MRASRFAPWFALLVTAATLVVAALTSRVEDWNQPLLVVLVGALALLADRYAVETASGSTVLAPPPVFVVGMVMLGPLPMFAIGELVVLANPASTRGRLAGNMAIYGVFLTGGSLL